MWDTTDLMKRATTLVDEDGLATDPVTAIAFYPDAANGATLAVGSTDGAVRMWSVDEQASEPIILPGPRSSVTAVAFNGDGSTLAAGHRNGAVSVWALAADGSSAELPSVLAGHAGRVRAIAFPADGRTLASAGDDRLVRVWLVHPEDLKNLICQRLWRDLTIEERDQFIQDAADEPTCSGSPEDRGTTTTDASYSVLADRRTRDD